MAFELPPHVWFVRSDRGSGSRPVTPEGWAVVRQFVKGVGLSMAGALIVGVAGTLTSSPWFGALGLGLFTLGMTWSAWRFIDTARRHTDYSITYNDYLKARKNA